jgi:serine protease Do
MVPSNSPARRALTARRLVLLATVATLGLGALVVAPSVQNSAVLTSPALAQSVRPAGFADIVERVKPAVISVRIKKAGAEQMAMGDLPFPRGSQLERFFREFGIPDQLTPRGAPQRRQPITGQGSGFFISADGYAVTNYHVVDGADTVEVTTDDGRTLTAKVIGTDPRTDIALIKVEGRNFAYVPFAESAPRIGDWVLAVGNPFGLGGTVTAGIVSARGRDIGAGPYDDFIQIDAPVNRGNSGGPTFNVDGSVIGVNTAIFSPSGGNVGIAFAIPAETVKSVVAQLKENGAVARGWIGVQIQPVTAEIADSLGLKRAEGALVAEPQAGGPAEKAGIRAGDVITAVNGEPVKNARELARRIGTMAPGATVKLSVLQKGAEKTVSITLGELPKTQEARASRRDSQEERGSDIGPLGLTLSPAASVPGSGNEGVAVVNVDPAGVAAEHGLKAGDIILEVGGKAVSSPADVRTALRDARSQGKRAVLFRVKSDEGARFVALPVGRA